MRHLPTQPARRSALAGNSFPGKAFPGLGDATSSPFTTDHRPLTTSHSSSRRGVLLLVVLSLLILFSLVAVTFVLVAGRYYDATRNAVRNEQVGDNPQRLLDEVLGQCIRGTTNPHSVLQGHSLLEDLYGNDGIVYQNPGTPLTVARADPAKDPNGQILSIQFTPTTAPITLACYPGVAVPAIATLPYPLSLPQIQLPQYYGGCVLTLLDGAGAGKSTRILRWSYSAGAYTAIVMGFNGVTYTELSADLPSSFVINGRPFNGTGNGFNPNANPTDPTLINAAHAVQLPNDSATVSVPSALLPNPVYWNGGTGTGGVTSTPPFASPMNAFGGYGGFDEDYDAPDPQNMLLAYIPLNATAGVGGRKIVPSLHRQETADYVSNMVSTYPMDGSRAARLMERQSILRPSSLDHPQFPRLVSSTYDVDNDGDGVAESIWVDVGLPVRTAPDGRTYKPMVAILCIDLDGRLNVNAHGSLAQLNTAYAMPINTGASPNDTLATYLANATGTGTAATLPRGLGVGPAEVNLAGLFANPATEYSQFLQGGTIGGVVYEGRYGESGAAGYAPFTGAMPGSTSSLGPDDYLAQFKRFGIPQNYYTTGVRNGYGSPGDLWGRAAIGLDYSGQPLYSFLVQGRSPELIAETAAGPPSHVPDPEWPHDPYSINLTRNRATQNSLPSTNDNLFSVAELERVLRAYDVDASALPDRLQKLLNPTGASTIELAKLITTDSNDLPMPAMTSSRDVANLMKSQSSTNTLPASTNLIDVIRAKLIQSGSFNASTASTAIGYLVNDRVIAPELAMGLRFDVNKPFGNGVDDDTDGIVDEPDEYSPNNEWPTIWNTLPGFTPATYMDLNRDGNPVDSSESIRVRQEYAQQLYLLMMALVDLDYVWAQDNSIAITPAVQREITARRIAQWAINVVDFRDPDSIMTPFEYDANPFDDSDPTPDGNPWDVDGFVSAADPNASIPDRRVVWGVERPELLLTETLAFHDRRVADLANDTQGSNNSMSSMPTPDDEYDQPRVPEGSLFLELYCPQSAKAPVEQNSASLYDASGRLILGQVANNYPVWRVAITRATTNAANLVSQRVTQHPDIGTFNPPLDASTDALHSSFFDGASADGQLLTERLIWFASLDPATHPDSATHSIYWNRSGTPTNMQPGTYAVIGPRLVTHLGLQTDGITAAMQSITLNPGAQTVQSTNPAGTATGATGVLNIVCSATLGAWPIPIGMNVSEPLLSSYYSQTPNGSGVFSPAYDLPLDGTPTAQNPNSPINGIWDTGVKSNFRFALLQRLANPTQAYNAETNPYITVDWQGIDLTVFSGEAAPSANADPANLGGSPGPYPVGSWQRGNTAMAQDAKNIWNPTRVTKPNNVAASGGSDLFSFALSHTLGFVNPAFGNRWNPAPTGDLAIYSHAPQPGAGQPYTLPWLTWNNRPFVSEAELMLVPSGAAEQVLRYFSYTNPSSNPYNQAAASYHLPFGHLFNFRFSGIGTNTSGPNYARLLEYLSVPTPFVGTETVLNPTYAPGGFLPPHNVVPDYREPGRININTIPGRADVFESPVWEGIRNSVGVPVPAPLWNEIVASRRGDTGTIYNVTDSWTTNPMSSYFARPFRSAAGAAYALPGTLPGGYPGNAITEVESTFLRPSITTGHGLFENHTGSAYYAHPAVNAYFHHQPLHRLRNLFTTRSNVYAIWITIGYFEVQTPRDNAGAALAFGPGTPYPDGYQLLQEMGSDTGEIERHRAFYIYDRSIPVGFEPGKDHNFADGLLLKRYIE